MKRAALTVFAVFFGISLLDALDGGQWLRAGFWIGIGLLFWRLEQGRGYRRPGGARSVPHSR